MARGRRGRHPGIPPTEDEVAAMLAGTVARPEALRESPDWEEEPLPLAWEPDTMKEARGEA